MAYTKRDLIDELAAEVGKEAKVSKRATSTATESDRIRLGAFLNFCPVIGYNGTRM